MVNSLGNAPGTSSGGEIDTKQVLMMIAKLESEMKLKLKKSDLDDLLKRISLKADETTM